MLIRFEKDEACLVDSSTPSLLSASKQISENKTTEPLIELRLAALPGRIIHTMLKGSVQRQLQQIVLFSSYVISRLLTGDLEAVCRINTAPHTHTLTHPPSPVAPLCVFVPSQRCSNNHESCAFTVCAVWLHP